MINIELDAYEKEDIIAYLTYAKKQKELNRPAPSFTKGGGSKFDSTDYDINRINQLIVAMDRKGSRINLSKNVDFREYITNDERRKIRYKKEKEQREKIII